MARKSAIWFGALALALTAPPTALAGPWLVSAGGGVVIPTGDFGDPGKGNANTGFQFGGALDYRVSGMFAVGIDGSWNRNRHAAEGETFGTFTFEEDRYDTWQVGMHGVYFLPAASRVEPYLVAGAGAYNTKKRWSGTDSVSGAESGETNFDTRFGFRGGVGAAVDVNEVLGLSVEGCYQFVSQDKDKVGLDNLPYIGITGMLVFNLME